jgi:hypothetical protein
LNRVKIDLAILTNSNPPTAPDLKGEIKRLSAGDWNINGQGGRIVNDALITQGRHFLKSGGEILFISTSKIAVFNSFFS